MMNEGTMTMRYGRRGFTLMEMLVTLAILGVVMTLLIFPIFSAYGYIQKARAQTEARLMGDRLLQRVKKELGTASYVYEIPPDSSMVTFIPGEKDPEVADTGDVKVKFVRFAQTLNFPWIWRTDKDTGDYLFLLKPNYMAEIDANFPLDDTYDGDGYDRGDGHYAPFWDRRVKSDEENPYILGRYETSQPLTWTDAEQFALDGSYPMKNWDTDDTPEDIALRKFRNEIISLAPLNDKWDVPRFQVSPLRIVNETLAMQVNAHGRKDPTVLVARYPLWAGRNRDIDNVLYDVEVDGVQRGLQTIFPQLTAEDKLNPLLPAWSPVGVNPFGYQIRIFDQVGGLVYGKNKDTASNADYMVCKRHYMDWPPIGRADWDNALWDKAEIARQRIQGKLVFAQPVLTDTLTMKLENGLGKAILLVPQGWEDASTYLTNLPQTIRLRRASDPQDQFKTFQRVDRISALGPGTFIAQDLGKFDNSSRVITFGEALVNGDWLVVDSSGVQIKMRYTVCDLQPTDVVVGTYSTKGVLNVELTVSRRDSAGGKPEQQRQDYSTNTRVIVRNAIERARNSQ